LCGYDNVTGDPNALLEIQPDLSSGYGYWGWFLLLPDRHTAELRRL
jgi:hypothetical protein